MRWKGINFCSLLERFAGKPRRATDLPEAIKTIFFDVFLDGRPSSLAADLKASFPNAGTTFQGCPAKRVR